MTPMPITTPQKPKTEDRPNPMVRSLTSVYYFYLNFALHVAHRYSTASQTQLSPCHEAL